MEECTLELCGKSLFLHRNWNLFPSLHLLTLINAQDLSWKMAFSNILQLLLSLSFFLKFCYIQIPWAWILPCWQATCFLYALFLFKSAHFFVYLFFTWMCLRWASWNTPISNKSASLILNRSVNAKNKKDGNPLLPSATKPSVTESWSDAMA